MNTTRIVFAEDKRYISMRNLQMLKILQLMTSIKDGRDVHDILKV